MSPCPADLLDAYRRAEYRVADGSYAFTLRIDEPSDSLRGCHAAFHVECSAFITACNPRSVPTAAEVNDAAMTRLEQELGDAGYFVLHGRGVDPAGAWGGEPSLLVLGMPLGEALATARRFDQHAIVWAGEDATPRLMMTGI